MNKGQDNLPFKFYIIVFSVILIHYQCMLKETVK